MPGSRSSGRERASDWECGGASRLRDSADCRASYSFMSSGDRVRRTWKSAGRPKRSRPFGAQISAYDRREICRSALVRTSRAPTDELAPLQTSKWLTGEWSLRLRLPQWPGRPTDAHGGVFAPRRAYEYSDQPQQSDPTRDDPLHRSGPIG